jgi:peroxiredoxin
MRTAVSYLLLLFLSVSLAAGQNITIQGSAPACKGKEAGLYTYDDLLTYRELKQSSTTIDTAGNFTLKLNSDIIQRVFIKIENRKGHLYAAPGGAYNVIFPDPDTIKYQNPNTVKLVSLNWKFKDTLDINALIIHYNMFFEDYYSQRYEYFVTNRAFEKIDSLRILSAQRYKHVKDPYFQNYIDYSITSFKASFSRNEKSIQKEFAKRPVQDRNNEYMELFNIAFKGYFQKLLLTARETQLMSSINDRSSYPALLETLAKEELLANDTLRELVMLKGIYDAYTDTRFKRDNLKDILEQAAAGSKIEEHRKMAANINRIFNTLALGSSAPRFELPDKSGKMVNLSDYKDKIVYIGFFTTTCTKCLQELKAFTDLKKELGDKVVLISISLDDTIDEFNSFLAKNPKYNWTFLYTGSDSRIKEDYNIKAIPAFFLINPQGKLAQFPAQSPSQGVEEMLKRMSKKDNKTGVPGQR